MKNSGDIFFLLHLIFIEPTSDYLNLELLDSNPVLALT